MRQINRLLYFYLFALSVLLGSVVTSLVLTDRIATSLEEQATLINKSGRQRTLSQKIAYLAQDISQASRRPNPVDLDAKAAELDLAITAFADAHNRLSTAPQLEESLSRLYFSEADGPSLDARVRAFIQRAREIVEDPSKSADLARLKEIERNDLLEDLDGVVTEMEALSVARVERMRSIEYASLLLAVFIVLIEIMLVFLPGHRLVRKTLGRLREQNDALEESRLTLDAQTAELRQSHDLIVVERARLEQAFEESEALRREQSEFTYAVSHDLKSPTNTVEMVLSEIAFMEEGRMNPDSKIMLDHGQKTVARMGEQIEDILAYAWSTGAREEAGRVDLQACVDDALADLRGDIEAAGAQVDVSEMPHVTGYSRQLRALFLNLISNAVKYRAPDRPPRVVLSCAEGPETGDLQIIVSDNGIGIEHEHHDRVFGLFQRLHTRDEFEGSGLGLCTCLRIARNHGGGIEIDSAPGKGSTFIVTLRSQEPRDILLENLVA